MNKSRIENHFKLHASAKKVLNFQLANRVLAYIIDNYKEFLSFSFLVDKEEAGDYYKEDGTYVQPSPFSECKDIEDIHYYHYHSLLKVEYNGMVAVIPAPMMSQSFFETIKEEAQIEGYRGYNNGTPSIDEFPLETKWSKALVELILTTDYSHIFPQLVEYTRKGRGYTLPDWDRIESKNSSISVEELPMGIVGRTFDEKGKTGILYVSFTQDVFPRTLLTVGVTDQGDILLVDHNWSTYSLLGIVPNNYSSVMEEVKKRLKTIDSSEFEKTLEEEV